MKKFKLFLILTSLVWVTMQSSYAQGYHYLKGIEFCVNAVKYKTSGYMDWAFSEWERGHDAGEFASAMMLAHCYMVERGTTRNLSKATSIIESWIPRNSDALVFAAYHWLPRDDFWTNEHLYESLCQDESEYGTLRYYFGIRDRRAADYGGKADISKSFKYAKAYLDRNPTNEYYVKLCKEIVGFSYLWGLGNTQKDLFKASKYLSEARILAEIKPILLECKDKGTLKRKIKEFLPVLKEFELAEVLTSDDYEMVFEEAYSAEEDRKEIVTHYLWICSPETLEFNEFISQNSPLTNHKAFMSKYDSLSPKAKQLALDAAIKAFEEDGWAGPEYFISFLYYQAKEGSVARNKLTQLWSSAWMYENYPLEKPASFIANYDKLVPAAKQLVLDEAIELALGEEGSRLKPDVVSFLYFQVDEDSDTRNQLAQLWCNSVNKIFAEINDVCLFVQEYAQFEQSYTTSKLGIDGSKICNYFSTHDSERLKKFMSDLAAIESNKKTELLKSFPSGSAVTDLIKKTKSVSNWDLLFGVDAKNELSDMRRSKAYLSLIGSYAKLNELPENYRNYVIKENDLPYDSFYEMKDLFDLFNKQAANTIQVSDYDEYLKKYPSAYYAEYCSEARLMLIADACTKSTPKECIKTLLSLAVYKETQQYIKKVTKTNKHQQTAAEIAAVEAAVAKVKAEGQARLADENEAAAKAKAEEQARIEAEKKAEAEAATKAAEQERLAAEAAAAAAKAKAEELAHLAAEKEAAAKAKAEEEARIKAEKAARKKAVNDEYNSKYKNKGLVHSIELAYGYQLDKGDVVYKNLGYREYGTLHPVELTYTIGYRFCNWMSVGVGAGVSYNLVNLCDYGDVFDPMYRDADKFTPINIPVFLNAKVYMSRGKCQPMLSVSGGIYAPNIDMLWDVGVGCNSRLSKRGNMYFLASLRTTPYGLFEERPPYDSYYVSDWILTPSFKIGFTF